MKRKKLMALCLAAAMSASMLAGCGSDGKEASGDSKEQSSAEESGEEAEDSAEESSGEEAEASDSEAPDDGAAGGAAAANVPAFEDIQFPDTMPANPTLAEDGWYDYDDMSVHYDLEFLTYNYGEELPANDPIAAWLNEKFNVTITLTTAASGDLESILSTRFSSDDVPDLFSLPSLDYGFTLGEQGLLVDASEIYPYMPQTCKFVTTTLLEYTTMEDGSIPVFTKYAIQDGDIWGLAIREDWLESLNMEMPTTLDELKEYARACTFDDPDGNGQDDTWFMTGAGNGTGFGCLGGFQPWFGNPAARAQDGKLVSPMLDGSHKGWITFMHELYDMNVLAPDWFTIDWESAKAYMLKGRVGMVNYPSGALYNEQALANDNDFAGAAKTWAYLPSLPDGAKGGAGGNAGPLWAIPKSKVEGDQGKLMRILHIMDSMCYGGDSYFATVQGGGNEIHEGYEADVREYLPDGTNYCYVDASHPGFDGTYGTTNLALATWQNFGYTLKWQMEYVTDDMDPDLKAQKEKTNEGIKAMAGYDRWPNDGLLSTVSTSTIAPNLGEYEIQQLYKFVVGERSMDEWDDYVKEWLDRGGRDVLTAQAEKLGVELPDEAK